AIAPGARITSSWLSPMGANFTTSPTPSTCPVTRWPPRRSARRSAFSRFTSLPTASRPIVQFNVSRETSYLSLAPFISTTVRHTPLCAMLSPTMTSARSRPLVSTVRRMPSGSGSMCSMRPAAATMAENMKGLNRKGKGGIVGEKPGLGSGHCSLEQGCRMKHGKRKGCKRGITFRTSRLASLPHRTARAVRGDVVGAAPAARFSPSEPLLRHTWKSGLQRPIQHRRERLRLHEPHHAHALALLARAVKEDDPRRPEQAEALEQRLVLVVVGGDVGLEQQHLAHALRHPRVAEGEALHLLARHAPVGIEV